MEHKREIVVLRDNDEFHGKSTFQLEEPVMKPEILSVREEMRKKGQGKLLLVALLENYCMLYDQSKEQNQRLFFVLCQQLCRMGIIDSSYFLEEFSTVRSSYKRAFKELVFKAMSTVQKMDSRSRGLIANSSSYELADDMSVVSSPVLIRRSVSDSKHSIALAMNHPPVPLATDISEYLESGGLRFQEEFAVVKILGRGAFGRVVQTKNNLDGCQYAVKIIPCPTGSRGGSLVKTLREVKLLAGISHHNVVGYYSSWMQYMEPLNVVGSEDDSDLYDDDSYLSRSQSCASQHSSVTSRSNMEYSESIQSIKPQPSFQRELVLFIQMELCSSTLHHWLEQLNTSPLFNEPFRRIEEKILHCFVDLLKGVQFIHKRGYIHRDLKPKNIYWKPELESDIGSNSSLGGQHGKWKIGDFGLATWHLSPEENFTSHQKQSLGIGTITYASPEQLDHDENCSYSYQTDIYSLGIILFELLVRMETGMERAQNLAALRSGIMPDDFLAARPKEAALILWMMSPDPELRPTIPEIFALEWFSPIVHPDGSDSSLESSIVLELKSQLYSTQETLRSVEEKNAELMRKVEDLERKLAECVI
jgi:translation initiation factor 2-alpha kinase 1